MTKNENSNSKSFGPSGDVYDAIVGYWWERRWFIIKVMAAAIVLFVAILLMMPNYFRANATIIIMPPRFQPEVRTQPLSVMTAQTLLQTGEIYQSVITDVVEARAALEKHFNTPHPGGDQVTQFAMMSDTEKAATLGLDPESSIMGYIVNLTSSEISGIFEFGDSELLKMTPDGLARMLSSDETVEKKTATDIVYSPLLTLTAVADSGAKAQVLANAWAFLFEKKYEQLSKQRTEKLYESIQNQQKVSQIDLDDIQTSVVKYQSEHNIELYDRQIADHSKILEQFNNDMLEKQADLDAQKVRLVHVTQLLAGLENEGGWIGELRYDAGQNGGTMEPLLNDEPATDTLTTGGRVAAGLQSQTLQARDRLISAMKRYQDFYRDQPVALLENQLNQLQKDYTDDASRLQQDITKKGVLAKSIGELNLKLDQTSKTIALSMAVPDETIGDAISNPARKGSLAELSKVQFERQELNPEWQALTDMQVTHSQQLSDVSAEITQLQSELPARKDALTAMQTRIYDARLGESSLKRSLDRSQIRNDNVFDEYTKLKIEEFELTKNSFMLEQEIGTIRESAARVKAQVEDYQQKLNASQADLQVLQARQKAIQRNVDLLLQKTQEAMIAVRENISDVSVSARAVAPEEHYFPKRGLLLALMTFVTGLVLLGGLAREKYLQLKPD